MHLKLAHQYWKNLLQAGDTAIDATCGNGNDTLFLAKLIGESGTLVAMDIQEQAIASTSLRLKEHLSESHYKKIELLLSSHVSFPPLQNVKLIVYNLGYLPGGNKAITTLSPTTIASIHNALELIRPGGIVSITCYPGHAEGLVEEQAILKMARVLDPKCWHVLHHYTINRVNAPSVVLIHKKD